MNHQDRGGHIGYCSDQHSKFKNLSNHHGNRPGFGHTGLTMFVPRIWLEMQREQKTRSFGKTKVSLSCAPPAEGFGWCKTDFDTSMCGTYDS